MGTEARLQPDPFERFRSELENARWSRQFLANYVSEISQQRHEEDIFRHMAFQLPELGENMRTANTLSELYEATNPEQKSELRKSIDMMTSERRLSWRFLV